jgi:hypothetical protein
MTTPIVTESAPRLEPVTADTFADGLEGSPRQRLPVVRSR